MPTPPKPKAKPGSDPSTSERAPRRRRSAAPAEGNAPRSGEGRPPRSDDGRPPRSGEARPQRSDDGRPSRSGEARAPRSTEGRPPRSGEGRPPRSDDGRPPRSTEGRPPRSGEGRPPRSNEATGERKPRGRVPAAEAGDEASPRKRPDLVPVDADGSDEWVEQRHQRSLKPPRGRGGPAKAAERVPAAPRQSDGFDDDDDEDEVNGNRIDYPTSMPGRGVGRGTGRGGPREPETSGRRGRGQLSAEDSEPQKLHKMLAQMGLGSRRELEEWIIAGRVSVNGLPAHTGQRIGPQDKIKVNGKLLRLRFTPRLPKVILYHKPEGEIVSRDDPEGRETVFDKLPRIINGRWIAVGRLDFNTSGLLVFTTSGELANRMMHPSSGLEREYAVRVMGELNEEQKEALLDGILLDDGLAAFTSIREEGGDGSNRWYRVVIGEGRNREVRRMFESVGLMVSRLTRVRYGPLILPPRLTRGKTLELKEDEILALMKAVGNPASKSVAHAVAKKARRRQGQH